MLAYYSTANRNRSITHPSPPSLQPSDASRDWSILKLARVKVEQALPVVISFGEVVTLHKLIEKPSTQCFFTVVYHLGLRLDEALLLQISDIDSIRIQHYVRLYRCFKNAEAISRIGFAFV